MSIFDRICKHHKPKPGPLPPAPPTPGPIPPTPVPPKPPPGTIIQIVNRSTVLTDAQIAPTVPDLQTQVNRDFLNPKTGWKGGPWNLEFVGKNSLTDLSAWQILVLDDSDQAGALGYHDLTPAGLPLGKIFAKTDIQYGESWTVTTSHELLEMLGDPNIDKEVTDPRTGWTYIYENCDAVENNTYTIGNTLVSDFVYTSWFNDTLGRQYDQLGVLTGPWTLAGGGYISVDKHDGKGWIQEYGQRGAAYHGYAARPKVGSRRERRFIPRKHWLRSTS